MRRLGILLTLVSSCSSLFAATNSWNGGDGAWDDQAKWNLNLQPAASQDIVITNTGTFSVTVNDNTASNSPGAMTVLSLTVSNAAGPSALLLTNRSSSTTPMTFSILNEARIDNGSTLKLFDASASGAGLTIQLSNLFVDGSVSLESSGTISVSGPTFQLASTANSTGTVSILGGSLISGPTLVIGQQGCGQLFVSNAVLQAPSVAVGVLNGAHGSWQVASGTNTVGYPRVGVGNGATGEVVVTGGELTSTYMELGGSGAGEASTGSLVISNGVVRTGYLSFANGLNGVGTVTVAGGKLDVAEAPGGYFGLIYLGNFGTGTLWQTGGEIDVRNDDPFGGRIRIVGEYGGHPYLGQLVCSGGVLRVSEVHVGHPSSPSSSGSSLWTIAGGTSFVERATYVMGDMDHIGLLTVSGGRLQTTVLRMGILIAGPFMFSAQGGSMIVSGGEVQVTQQLDLSAAFPPVSRLLVAGGEFKVVSVTSPGSEFPALIGSRGAGELTVSGGAFRANQIWVGGSSGGAGTLTVSGGLVDAAIDYSLGTILDIGVEADSAGSLWYTGGNLHARTITVGDAGFGNMFVSSNADFQPLGMIVANQSGSVGLLNIQGGALFGPPVRQTFSLQIGVASNSTGTVWVTNGALRAGYYGCYPDSSVMIGEQGSGRLSATNSIIGLLNLSVGGNGTLECVNSEFYALDGGCPTINSNVMLFINSTGSFEAALQNSATIMASGSTLTFLQSVNNSGTIIATNGTVQFLGGITNAGNVVFGPDQFLITSAVRSNRDVVISWRVFGGNHYRVQATTNFPASYSDIGPEIVAAGSDFSVTNYIDGGAATNFPSRIYRVRQVL